MGYIYCNILKDFAKYFFQTAHLCSKGRLLFRVYVELGMFFLTTLRYITLLDELIALGCICYSAVFPVLRHLSEMYEGIIVISHHLFLKCKV